MVKRLLGLVMLLLSLHLPAAAVELDIDNNQAIDIAKGGTNATTAGGARTALGLNALSSAALSCLTGQIPKLGSQGWGCGTDDGSVVDLSSPGPIGATTPAAGTFSALSVVGGGINVIGSSTPDGTWGQWVFQSDNSQNWVLFRPKTDFSANYTITLPLISGDVAIIVAAPAAAADSCSAGSVALDSGYFYYCVASGDWRRTALSTW